MLPKDQETLDAHLVDHYLYKESQFCCANCSKVFSQPDELQKHLLEVHALHVFKCSLCKELFETRVDIQVHFAVVHSKEMVQWRCRSCNSVFSSNDQFRIHVEVVHLQRPLTSSNANTSRQSGGDLVCRICNKECGSKTDLAEHTLQHSPFPCPVCPQSFSVEYLFERHMESAHSDYSAAFGSLQNLSMTSKQEQRKLTKPVVNFSSHGKRNLVMGPDGLLFPLVAANSTALKCNICDEKSETVKDLAEHKLVHCKVKKSDFCHVCREPVNSLEEFCGHVKRHNAVNGLPVSCIVCRQSLLSPVELHTHARFHLTSPKQEASEEQQVKRETPSEEDSIMEDGETSRSPSVDSGVKITVKLEENCAESAEVDVDMEVDGERKEVTTVDKPFQCIKCQKSFRTEAEIQAHVTSHVLQDGVEHYCLLCQKVFDSPAKLQCHLIEHSFIGCVEYQCYLCGLIFSLPQPLSQHMLCHGAEERPYDCPYCDQRFFFRAELDNHVLSHQQKVQLPLTADTANHSSPRAGTGMHPFWLRIKSNSDDDVLFAWTHTNRNGSSGDLNANGTSTTTSFPCPHCPKVFSSLSALQGHSHVHMANRIHQCHRCNKSFPTATKLRNHQRQHSGDKPYACDICTRHFSRKDNLKVHMRTHYKDGYAGSGDELPTMVTMSQTIMNDKDCS